MSENGMILVATNSFNNSVDKRIQCCEFGVGGKTSALRMQVAGTLVRRLVLRSSVRRHGSRHSE
jgi:hypothetical protein